MDVAVLMYGQPRFIDEGFEFFEKFFSNINIDYYFHLWGDKKDYQKVSTVYNPTELLVEQQIENIVSNFKSEFDTSHTNKSIQISLSPLLSMYKVGKLLEDSYKTYDLVVLTRTDVAANTFKLIKGKTLKELFRYGVRKNTVYLNFLKGDFWKLNKNHKYNKNLKGVDTKFIAGSKDTILALTRIFENLDDLVTKDGVWFCHHRLFYFTLSNKVKKFKYLKIHKKNKTYGWHWIRKNGEEITYEPKL